MDRVGIWVPVAVRDDSPWLLMRENVVLRKKMYLIKFNRNTITQWERNAAFQLQGEIEQSLFSARLSGYIVLLISERAREAPWGEPITGQTSIIRRVINGPLPQQKAISVNSPTGMWIPISTGCEIYDRTKVSIVALNVTSGILIQEAEMWKASLASWESKPQAEIWDLNMVSSDCLVCVCVCVCVYSAL